MSRTDRKPHIAFILGTPLAGGAQQMVLNLVRSRALQEYCHTIIFIVGKSGKLLDKYHKAGASTIFCPIRWPSSTFIPSYRANRWLRNQLEFTFPFRLGIILRRRKVDIVNSQVWANLVGQAKGIVGYARLPWVFTSQGTYDPRIYSFPHGTTHRLAAAINSTNSCITGVSAGVLKSWTEAASFLPEKTHVIHNAIDVDRFANNGYSRSDLRVRLGIPKDAVVFGSVTRLFKEKRVDILVEAAAQVSRAEPSAYFLVAGEGPTRPALEALILRHRLEHRFRLVGYQDNIPQFLMGLDVFVLSSDTEGLSLALLEAQAAGLPCIATDVNGVREVLGNGNGVIVQPQSPLELAKAMRFMLSLEVRSVYVRTGHESIRSFSIEAVAGQYQQLYRKMLDQRRR